MVPELSARLCRVSSLHESLLLAENSGFSGPLSLGVELGELGDIVGDVDVDNLVVGVGLGEVLG